MPPSDKGKEPKVKKKPGRRQTSCAECRRLKLKCDKNVPCEKCVSRGCGQICPEGVLTSTKGNRMVLTGTEELHDRIAYLGGRIRELEDALRSLQEQVSDQPHPLLRTDILRPPPPPLPRPGSHHESSSASASSSAKSPTSGSDRESGPIVDIKPKDEKRQDIDAFGTLTIHQDGVSKYIGKTARSEFLMCAESQSPHASEAAYSPFPDFEPRPEIAKEHIYRKLPVFSQATHLCDIYLRHSKHLHAAIPRTELYDDILMTVYRTHSYDSFQVHHAMALLFAVFALALHFDGQRESYEFYQLARTTLGIASPVLQTTVASIQTLIHMAQYLDFSDWESSGSASAWLYIGHAVRLGYSIGLNLNPARWKLPETDVTQRRRVFWQLFVADTWTSFCFGRPPSISHNYIDCPIPEPSQNSSNGGSDGVVTQTDFEIWVYRFTTLLNSVMASGLGPTQPMYSRILDLDCQIREFPVPSPWRAAIEREPPTIPPEVHYYRWVVLACKETTLLNLHRGYFAQALYETMDDLQDHRYMPSVVAIYRSSWRIVTGLQLTWMHVPNMIQRVNLPWSQGLSAAIVMCLLITRAPSSHLVAPALDKLGQLLALFHAASPSCRSAANLLPSIQRLYNKAWESDNPPRYQPSASPSESSITQAELDRLGGKTYLFSQLGMYSHPSSSSSTLSSSSSSENKYHPTHSSSGPLVTGFSNLHIDGLHPVLAEDLRDYAARATVASVPTLSDGSSPSGDSPTITTPTGIQTERSRSSQSYIRPPPPPLSPSPMGRATYQQPQQYHNTHQQPQLQRQHQDIPEPPHYPPAHSIAPASTAYQQPTAHYPPPAYLPPSPHTIRGNSQHQSLGQSQGQPQTQGHGPASDPPLPPLPGQDPSFTNQDHLMTDRKYATLTNCSPGINPTIDLLDSTWQSLVEQLGY